MIRYILVNRLALITLHLFALIMVAFISLGFYVSVAHACDSFEDCMNGRDAKIWTDCYDKFCYEKGECPADVGLQGSCYRSKNCDACKDVTPIATNYDKAIAYKLDEISKKLDRPSDDESLFRQNPIQGMIKKSLEKKHEKA